MARTNRFFLLIKENMNHRRYDTHSPEAASIANAYKAHMTEIDRRQVKRDPSARANRMREKANARGSAVKTWRTGGYRVFWQARKAAKREWRAQVCRVPVITKLKLKSMPLVKLGETDNVKSASIDRGNPRTLSVMYFKTFWRSIEVITGMTKDKKN